MPKKKSWECPRIESVPMCVENDDYKQAVDELANLIYSSICQLSENQISASPLKPGSKA